MMGPPHTHKHTRALPPPGACRHTAGRQHCARRVAEQRPSGRKRRGAGASIDASASDNEEGGAGVVVKDEFADHGHAPHVPSDVWEKAGGTFIDTLSSLVGPHLTLPK